MRGLFRPLLKFVMEYLDALDGAYADGLNTSLKAYAIAIIMSIYRVPTMAFPIGIYGFISVSIINGVYYNHINEY